MQCLFAESLATFTAEIYLIDTKQLEDVQEELLPKQLGLVNRTEESPILKKPSKISQLMAQKLFQS